MALWTDVIDPATLTGYARASLAEYEARKGTLAVFLPNRTIPDITARFVAGSNGLLDAAEFRSYDAETPVGAVPSGKRVSIELPPLGMKVRVSEYEQLRARGQATDENVATSMERVTDRVVAAVADRIEIARGGVINTGKATINENGFQAEADYGRSSSLNVTAATLWAAGGASPLTNLQTWRDVYIEENGDQPGSILMSTKAYNAMQAAAEFRALAATSAGTPAIVTRDFVQQVLTSFGLPPIVLFDRKVRVNGTVTRVTPDNKVFMLPAPVDANDSEGTDLGGTFWGQTLESSEANYGIEAADQPGIVAGAYKDDDPLGVWIKSAAIGLPVLANANLSLAATVLA